MSNGRLYFVTTKEGQYVMTAPMHVLIRYFGLHTLAVERIERETAVLGQKCTIHSRRWEDDQGYQLERLEDAVPSPQENSHAEG